MLSFKKSALLALIVPTLLCAKTGTVQVGTDNAGHPIIMGYKTKGTNAGKPVLVFADAYLGINSWQHVQNKFSDDYFTIAFDTIGYGTSSKNVSTALDGIGNLPGYSFRQQAYFLHQLLVALAPQGPITYVAVDTQGQAGMWYVKDYATSQYPITKLIFEDSNPSPYVAAAGNACTLAFLSAPVMQSIVDFYTVNPQGAITAILGGSFETTDCPSVNQEIVNLCVAYATTATADTFGRIALVTYLEDLTPLMSEPEFANLPVCIIYGGSGDNLFPLSRKACGSFYFGNAPGWPNPSTPGTCTTPPPFYNPFPNCRFITYPGHGTIPHLTAFNKYVRDLGDFASGNDSACSIRLPS